MPTCRASLPGIERRQTLRRRLRECIGLLYAFSLSGFADASSPVQLEKTNFTTFIDGVPASHGVLLEFYANWCPTCQRFQPTYDKVAAYFNAQPRVKPEVIVARTDCATQFELCNNFSIARYPTLKYGLPAAFKPGSEKKLEEFTDDRTAVQIIRWLGEQKGVEFNYDPSQESQEDRRSVAVSVIETEAGVPLKINNEDIQKATFLAFKYALETPELLKGSESRSAFLAFSETVAAAHPSERCRSGAQKLVEAARTLWPEDSTDGPGGGLKDVAAAICGDEPPSHDWRGCKGSKENTRGYTCGLWMLFHSLAGRMEPHASGGTSWMAAVKGYVQHFFQCSDCAKHFTEMASESAATGVTSRKDAVLWAWRAHNEVNRRLEATDSSGNGGDPAFPKKQWPPSELCPLCRLPQLAKHAEVTWNVEEIYRFLLKYYDGSPEQGWVTGKLESGSKLLGLGGRRNLERRGSAGGGRRIGLLLLFAILLAAAAAFFAARQRTRPDRRKIVSL